MANIYYKEGYTEVESKAGMHPGTYKVYVNYMPIADITYLDNKIFASIIKDSIVVNEIHYAPPNYLRMSMYLELSRPDGDVSRWEKVLKRLILLNKHYPMKHARCNALNFMRSFESGTKKENNQIYDIVKNSLINQGLVFFGGYAATLYGRYMPSDERKALDKYADFDVLSEDAETSAIILKVRLLDAGLEKINIYNFCP